MEQESPESRLAKSSQPIGTESEPDNNPSEGLGNFETEKIGTRI